MGVFEMKLGSGEIKFGGPSIGPSFEKNGGSDLMKNGGSEPK